ncbi:hypothetical protein Leryth_010642 [Lithospermum erythrorhizon]|nr:hypothetical protein Leryth_010642 [Lithospermum erythrorhizon]
METPTTACKSKNKLLKMLPRAASSISFHDLPFSPHRIKNRKKHKKVAKEEKRANKLKNEGSAESLYGPTSPKISCMGQIKHKKKQAQNMHMYLQKEICPFSSPQIYCSKNKSSSVIKPMFYLSEAEKIPSNMRNNGRKSDASANNRPLCLNQMKRFASCRGGALTNYDWKIARMELDHLDQYFEEWKMDYQVDEEGDEEEVVVGVNEVPISAASIEVVGGVGDGHDQQLKPREEINIWQRRTIPKPPTLNIQRCH